MTCLSQKPRREVATEKATSLVAGFHTALGRHTRGRRRGNRIQSGGEIGGGLAAGFHPKLCGKTRGREGGTGGRRGGKLRYVEGDLINEEVRTTLKQIIENSGLKVRPVRTVIKQFINVIGLHSNEQLIETATVERDRVGYRNSDSVSPKPDRNVYLTDILAE